MLIENLISRSLARSPKKSDLHLLGLLANPAPALRIEAQRVPKNLRYYRSEHESLLVYYPNEYTRRHWFFIFFRASD